MLLQQRLPGRCDRELMQLGGDASAIAIGFGRCQTLAQLADFFFADAASSNLWAAAGCRHESILRLEVCGSRTCKPNSVRRIAPAGRPFLWAAHCCAALATYPEVRRTEPARAPSSLEELPQVFCAKRTPVRLAKQARLRAALTDPSLNKTRFAQDNKHSQRRRDFLPIWSCSVWGLPCPRHYWRGGALLPHLFTLTPLILETPPIHERASAIFKDAQS